MAGDGGVDVKSDAEIFFLPSITLDNGLKFGANIQLEGNTSGDQIDESYLIIKGSFGEINLGSENSAGYKMHYAAPDATFVGVNSGDLGNYIPFSGMGVGADIFRGTLGASYIENARNNDATRMTYYTPRFAGFQVGVSYARDANQDSNAQVDTDAELSDLFDVAANYVNTFGDISIALSGRYGTASAKSAPDPDVWGVGGQLGFAGFTIGGSYAKQDDSGTKDGRYWDAGIMYETGPWGFSFTYANGKNVDNDCYMAGLSDVGISCTDDDETLKQYLAGIDYDLAKGARLGALVGYADFESGKFYFADDETSDTSEMDGWVIGAGVRISF